ncbi:MAG: pentapeptide repeat-containing protein [Nostoc sp.]|uniref:pentapeptide repeat-containing protein n=1 Tax=Nostoc sp. TaxID=1180 RepID=UPI002FFA440C
MANEEHLAILKQGVQVWNEWRDKNPSIQPNFVKAKFPSADFRLANFNNANFKGADLSGAKISRATFRKADLSRVDFGWADLSRSDLSEAKLIGTDLSQADLIAANFTKANLWQVNLTETDLSVSKLIGANLSNAILIETKALATNFNTANLTGACIEDWHINSDTNFTDVICDYIYLCQNQQERRPSSGNFAPGEFTKLFQKSLETLDLIFRNGIDWDAFAYSFKKLEVENQGAQLDVQSIEKKGDGILVVRVAVSPDADKAKIHSDFMQGYEFAARALEAQYQVRLEDKEKVINQLFSTINQQNQLLAQTGDKVSIYYQPNSQFTGGIVDATNVDAQQIGGSIHNNNA